MVGRATLQQCLATAILLLVTCLPRTALAQKTDIVTLINGDKLTGEIKELERGLMRFKTDSIGTIYIEWLDIASITSNKFFSLETASGVLAFGSLSTTDDEQSIDVSYADRTVRLRKSSVVELNRVKDTFWKRLDGSVGLGFSYRKANDDVQLNFSADTTYQAQRNIYIATLSALVSSQNQNVPTERYTGSFSHQGYIRPKWSSLARLDLEQNTELDLRLRTLIQGGGLYRFIQTNRTRLDSAAGLALNDEQYFTVGKEDRTSLEAFGSVGYEFFKFNTPKADVSARFTVFPSLTESGRVRTQTDAKVRWEIIKDLNWAITLFLSTDNKPPEAQTEEGSAQASGEDYGIITSLEYTF